MPELWLHRGASDKHFLDRDMVSLRKRYPKIVIRTVLALPRLKPRRLEALAAAADDFVVDPCCHERYDKKYKNRALPQTKLVDYRYLFDSSLGTLSSSSAEEYLEDVMADSSSAVICPCLNRLELADWEKPLRDLVRNIEAVRECYSGEMMLELILGKAIVSDDNVMGEILSWLLPQGLSGLVDRFLNTIAT
jgi:hypothetical protein